MITVFAEAILIEFLRYLIKVCNQNRLRTIVVSILTVYLIGVFIMTIGIRGFDDDIKINIIPFRALFMICRQIILCGKDWGIRAIPHEFTFMVPAFKNLYGNILLLLPLGYLVPLFRISIDRWWKVARLGIGVSFFIEITQLLTHHGFFDIDDLILNTLGCLIGWICYKRWLCRKKGETG